MAKNKTNIDRRSTRQELVNPVLKKTFWNIELKAIDIFKDISPEVLHTNKV